ncbi:MAG: septum formation initiator family protein [Chitinophagaceae bacterium]|nr:septum formation initiator family protein [Chitinophagaceae bacterium]MCW5925932.1 septum formation initiator family protein [Chitinophagaceae bacterium]
MFKKMPAWLKNKYAIATAAFVVWLVFFDHNDLFTQIERTNELRQLENGKSYYSEQIENIREELAGLQSDSASLEKIAREKYMMKKDNEDLYIIKEKK